MLKRCVSVGYGYLSAPGDGTYEGNGMEARGINKTQRTVSTVSWYVVVVVSCVVGMMVHDDDNDEPRQQKQNTPRRSSNTPFVRFIMPFGNQVRSNRDDIHPIHRGSHSFLTCQRVNVGRRMVSL